MVKKAENKDEQDATKRTEAAAIAVTAALRQHLGELASHGEGIAAVAAALTILRGEPVRFSSHSEPGS